MHKKRMSPVGALISDHDHFFVGDSQQADRGSPSNKFGGTLPEIGGDGRAGQIPGFVAFQAVTK